MLSYQTRMDFFWGSHVHHGTAPGWNMPLLGDLPSDTATSIAAHLHDPRDVAAWKCCSTRAPWDDDDECARMWMRERLGVLRSGAGAWRVLVRLRRAAVVAREPEEDVCVAPLSVCGHDAEGEWYPRTPHPYATALLLAWATPRRREVCVPLPRTAHGYGRSVECGAGGRGARCLVHHRPGGVHTWWVSERIRARGECVARDGELDEFVALWCSEREGTASMEDAPSGGTPPPPSRPRWAVLRKLYGLCPMR